MNSITKIRVVLAGVLVACGVGATPATAQVFSVSALPGGRLLAAGTFCEPNDGDPNCSFVAELAWTDEFLWETEAAPIEPHSAQRLANGNTLIADTGNNRVIEVDPQGAQVWQDDWLAPLNSPTDARRLPNGNTLVVDSGNHRVIEVEPAGTIVWQFGETGIPGGGPRLANPNKAERLANGNTLIADSGNHRIITVNGARQIVSGLTTGLVSPKAATRLANGNTLIADDSGVRWYSPQGLVLSMIVAGESAFDVKVEPNGNVLCSGLDWIREFSPTGQLIREVILTHPSPPCDGDLNGDSRVDLVDLAGLLANFGMGSGATRAQGDLTGDGAVGLTDLAELLGVFGAVCE